MATYLTNSGKLLTHNGKYLVVDGTPPEPPTSGGDYSGDYDNDFKK